MVRALPTADRVFGLTIGARNLGQQLSARYTPAALLRMTHPGGQQHDRPVSRVDHQPLPALGFPAVDGELGGEAGVRRQRDHRVRGVDDGGVVPIGESPDALDARRKP